jgi:hypothetical protein
VQQDAVEVVGGKVSLPFDQGPQLADHVGPSFHALGIALQMELVAPQDDVDLKLIPQPAQVPVPRAEQAANVLVIPKPDSTF